MRYALYAIGALLGSIVIGALLLDEGEVVTLTTRGDNGTSYETQLWVVESEGGLFLRASSPGSQWLARVRANPEVELRRGDDATGHYVARPEQDAALLEQVNRAMAEKYGFSDWLYGHTTDRAQSVVVRLEPAPE